MKFQPYNPAKKDIRGTGSASNHSSPKKGASPPLFSPKTQKFSQYSLFEPKNTFLVRLL